jgi:DUF1365 family protein
VRSALYTGTVMHARRAPRANVFRYPVFMALVDLEELPELDRELPLFGWNRRAVASYHDADHIDVRHVLAEHGVELGEAGRLQVLTNLRVLGYVFNPVAFWWAWRADGTLVAVVAEVSNTFRERLPYVLLPADGAAEEGRCSATSRTVWETGKRLHVSPFMPMDQSYTWWLSEPGRRLSIRMDVHQAHHPDFHATLTASRRPLTAASLRSVLVRYPLMPARVTALIHWQALRLSLKRTPFFTKPPFVAGEGTRR